MLQQSVRVVLLAQKRKEKETHHAIASLSALCLLQNKD